MVSINNLCNLVSMDIAFLDNLFRVVLITVMAVQRAERAKITEQLQGERL